jgi:hypothetical protein
VLLLGGTRIEILLTNSCDCLEMHFVEAADGRDAHLKAEAVRRFGGDEGADFGVYLSGRCQQKKSISVWFRSDLS